MFIKYSIITVCLNSQVTIRRCLESVKNQTIQNYEHIIIDGGSTDLTMNILSNYHVHCVSEKDNGIYDAMNKGAKIAKGEYILFLNSDDELLPNFLLECDKISNNYTFISSSINMKYEGFTKFWIPKLKNTNYFSWRMPIPHAGLLVKTKVFNELGGFSLNYKIASDYDFILKLLKSKYSGYVINKPMINFYMGGASQNINIIKENNNVRKGHYNKILFLKLAFLFDCLRYLKYNISYILPKKLFSKKGIV
jgi:glycosyltransferase involved in cell wall biosynthesis